MNACAVGIIRYGAGVLEWTKEELKSIDIKTRELINMNESLHPRGNVGRLYFARKEGGRGLISCEERVNVEVQSLDKNHSESLKWMLKFVAREKGLPEVEDRDAFKNRLKEKANQWLEKPLHGRFLKDIEKMSTERTWQWLKGDILRKRLKR